jgi:hypothetical protein
LKRLSPLKFCFNFNLRPCIKGSLRVVMDVAQVLAGQGLADPARHVIDTHFDPSLIEFHGIL